jgi:hypothetical protein
MSRPLLRSISLLLALSPLVAPIVHAQDRPVAFLHGFRSDGAGWADTADRLRQGLAIETHLPNLPWRASFAEQAHDLRGRWEYGSLPGSTIAIGHSNGGLVAREWSRHSSLGGIVTLGTPHRGTPILPHFAQWAGFNASSSWLASSVLDAFSGWTDFTWTFGYVSQAIGWVLDFNVWSVSYLALSLGLDDALPVAGDMHPLSPYLATLNSGENIGREHGQLGARVGIVSVAHNFYWAGPARAIFPEQADTIADLLYGAAYGIMYWGSYILASADPLDASSVQQGLSLLALSGHLLDIDPVYCRMVSSIDLSSCVPHDGLVPYTSQEYPGAANLFLGQNNDGPAHTRERAVSEDVLYHALVNYLGVPPRTSTPPPGSGGGPGGGGGSGGGTGGTGGGFVFDPGGVLYPGDQLDSPNAQYHLIYQHDSNFVLYDAAWSPIWASGTAGHDPGFVVMQHDGNLVLYDASGVPRWASDTSNHPLAYLTLQDDGNVVVYGSDGTTLWATGTNR